MIFSASLIQRDKLNRVTIKQLTDMKKVIFTALATILTLSNSFAQDVITKKTSEDIPAKVIEVTTTEVKYKKHDNQNGPTFSLLKTEV
jgi:hypothetical protein